MDSLLREDFETLLADHGGPCVSLFLPFPHPGLEMRQGPVRLRNLLREAQERLLGHGLLPAEAGALLAPAKDLVEDEAFWQQAGDGLAIFCSADIFRTFRLPLLFRERIVVGRRFAIKPLLPLTSGHGTFYILALSQNQVRLFAGRQHSVREVELTGVPRSLAEALGDQETTEMLQSHTASPAGRGSRPAIISGGGAGQESVKVELLRYCRQVDHGLRHFLSGRTAPLVVAGAAPLPSIYREASSYPYLLEDEIPGNPEHRSAWELHDLAWPIVSPRFEEARKSAVERFSELMGTGKASADLAEVVPAARGGRVDVLFVPGDEKEATAMDEELLEAAAMFTLRNGGTTYEVEAAQVPGGGPVAAVFRY